MNNQDIRYFSCLHPLGGIKGGFLPHCEARSNPEINAQ